MAIDVVEYGSKWEKLAGTGFIMQHSFFNPHDFAITPDYYIFFQVRSISSGCFQDRRKWHKHVHTPITS
jgi:hypothetical protein